MSVATLQMWDDGAAPKGNSQDIHSPGMLTRLRSGECYVFEAKDLLGTGAFARVYRGAKEGCGTPVAVKVVDRSKDTISCTLGPEAERYREVLKGLSHPYVITYFDIVDNEDNSFDVMELCTGGDFLDFVLGVKAYTETDVAGWTKQLLEGLEYIHSHGLTHRDIKPENIRWSNSKKGAVLKLVDFGMATLDLKERELTRLPAVGTADYAAPEVLAENYNKQCDIWSVGVALVLLFTGDFPYEVVSSIHPAETLGSYDALGPAWDRVSPRGCKVVEALLNPDPLTRVTATQALALRWTGDAPADSPKRKMLGRDLRRSSIEEIEREESSDSHHDWFSSFG